MDAKTLKSLSLLHSRYITIKQILKTLPLLSTPENRCRIVRDLYMPCIQDGAEHGVPMKGDV